MQKAFSLIALLSLLLILQPTSQSTAVSGVAIASFTTTTAFSCLINQGNTEFIIRIFKANDTYWGIDQDGYQNLVNINAAHSHPDYVHIHAYMELCRNNDPIDQVADMIDDSPVRLYETLYVKVIPSENPNCKWELYTHAENCQFLMRALDEIQSYQPLHRDLNVGVFSTVNIWAQFFGNSCNNIGKAYPSLWYANYESDGHVNSTKSFDDFISFGGWNAPEMKQTQGNTTATQLCGKGWHVFLDRVWREEP